MASEAEDAANHERQERARELDNVRIMSPPLTPHETSEDLAHLAPVPSGPRCTRPSTHQGMLHRMAARNVIRHA